MTRLYEPRGGEDIETTAQAMVALAVETGDTILAEFNGTALRANRHTTPEQILAVFKSDIEKGIAEQSHKEAEWRKTPEGIEATRKESEREAKAEKLRKGPLPAFTLRDDLAWKKAIGANIGDPYGAACIRYAAYWAHLMEQTMAKGANVADVEDVAEKCSHDADLEGITGFMYGAAVSMLARCWIHGEALRRWHNKETQIGTEGDAANKSGGVLNPALLNIQVPG